MHITKHPAHELLRAAWRAPTVANVGKSRQRSVAFQEPTRRIGWAAGAYHGGQFAEATLCPTLYLCTVGLGVQDARNLLPRNPRNPRCEESASRAALPHSNSVFVRVLPPVLSAGLGRHQRTENDGSCAGLSALSSRHGRPHLAPGQGSGPRTPSVPLSWLPFISAFVGFLLFSPAPPNITRLSDDSSQSGQLVRSRSSSTSTRNPNRQNGQGR